MKYAKENFMLEFIILGKLYSGFSATSYDIKKGMENSTEFFHSTSLGAIHPTLKNLEGENYLTSREEIENNRLKKYYTITEKGKAYFDRLIREDLGTDKLKCPQLLKVFFFNNLELDEQIESIDSYLKFVEETKARLLNIRDMFHSGLEAHRLSFENFKEGMYQMDTLQFGLEYYGFVADWFTRYKETLKERDRKSEV